MHCEHTDELYHGNDSFTESLAYSSVTLQNISVSPVASTSCVAKPVIDIVS